MQIIQRRVVLFWVAGWITVALAQCGYLTSTTQKRETILVSAASSLEPALVAIRPDFESTHPRIKVVYNFASSGTLQQQIEQGAPSDVFISAALSPMDRLQQKELIRPETRQNLFTNRLVLIVPKLSRLGLQRFQDLVKVRRLSLGEPRTVPAGEYGEAVLRRLGLLAALQSKFVFANNVRAVLAAVESGNVDAGLVYATDAKLSDQVKVVAIAPVSLHPPIVYPIAILKTSPHQSAASTYCTFLSSQKSKRLFQTFGFNPV